MANWRSLEEGPLGRHPVGRLFIPKPNGNSGVGVYSSGSDPHDSGDSVLEPIFEADLPPERYGYRPGATPQAVTEVQALMLRAVGI